MLIEQVSFRNFFLTKARIPARVVHIKLGLPQALGMTVSMAIIAWDYANVKDRRETTKILVISGLWSIYTFYMCHVEVKFVSLNFQFHDSELGVSTTPKHNNTYMGTVVDLALALEVQEYPRLSDTV